MPAPINQTRFSVAFAIWLLVSVAIGAVFFFVASESERTVAFRTVGLGIAAALIAVPLGGLIAWACQGRGVVSGALLACTVSMLLVPMFIHVSGWDAAFGKLGWFTSTKGQILVPLVFGWTAAIWIHGVAAAPQVAVILLVGLHLGRRVFEEQALLDTSPVGVFWHITIKRITPLIILSMIWVVISCAREIAVTDLYQIGTLAEQIYLGYSLGLNSIAGNWTPEQLAEAGTVSNSLTIALVAWLALSGFLFFGSITRLEYDSQNVRPAHLTTYSLWRSAVAGILVVLIALIPIGNVVLRACFYVRPIDGVPTQGYSLNQLFRAIARSCSDYQNEFVWSCLISFTSATLILILSIVLASTARRSRPGQLLLAMALAICCAVPGPLIGTSIAATLAGIQNETIHWFYNYTIAAPVVANAVFCWPIGALLIWFVFRKIPQDSLEHSSLDGAGSVTRFFRLGVMGNVSVVMGCWLLLFANCFGELSASQIVRPAGIDTVPRKMLGDLHAGVNEMTAGITIVTAFTIVAISLAGWCFLRLNRTTISRQ